MDIGKSIGLEYGLPIRNAFGETLREVGGENPNLVVLDGDVGNSTRTNYFRDAYPERFFNFGIAESNMVGTASGLAAGKDVLALAGLGTLAETLNPYLSVGQILRRPLRRLRDQPTEELDAAVRDLLEAVHLSGEYASLLPGQLSGGEKRRVAIARAFRRGRIY